MPPYSPRSRRIHAILLQLTFFIAFSPTVEVLSVYQYHRVYVLRLSTANMPVFKSATMLARRDHTSASDPLNPIYIAGFCIAGVAVLSLAVWLCIRLYRMRAAAKRVASRDAAFLSVRGVVSEKRENERSVV